MGVAANRREDGLERSTWLSRRSLSPGRDIQDAQSLGGFVVVSDLLFNWKREWYDGKTLASRSGFDLSSGVACDEQPQMDHFIRGGDGRFSSDNSRGSSGTPRGEAWDRRPACHSPERVGQPIRKPLVPRARTSHPRSNSGRSIGLGISPKSNGKFGCGNSATSRPGFGAYRERN